MTDKIAWTNEMRCLGELVPWPRNPRQIKQEQAKRLGESLEEFGQVDVIAIGPDNEVYNGHQRLNVWADQHGPNFEVAVRVSSRALTEKEREKLAVFLHKGAAGEWDFDMLANEFELEDLLSWGFEESELDLDLWKRDQPAAPEAQMDRADELQEKWRVQPGQVWQIGQHRLMCGNCLSEKDVVALMGGAKAALVWTDPPYGIRYGDKLEAMHGQEARQIEGDDLSPVDLERMLRRAYILAAENTMPGAAIYTCCASGSTLPVAIAALHGTGFIFHWQLVWVKDRLVLGRGDYHARHENILYGAKDDLPGDFAQNEGEEPGEGDILEHENILYGWKQDSAHYFTVSRKRDSVFVVPRPTASKDHPTMKPPPLIAQQIENSSREGWGVYDGFSGSGSTLVACEMTARIGYAMEIVPKYCAVTLERMTEMELEPRLLAYPKPGSA